MSLSPAAASWRAKAMTAPVLSGVAETDVDRLMMTGRPRQCRDDDVVFSRGEEARAAYMILSGQVKISTLGPNGKRIVVEIFQAGDIFGEVAVIDGQTRTADASAIGPVDLVAFPDSAVRDLLDRSAAFAGNVLRLITHRLRRTYSLLEDASLLNLELRLAKQVLYLIGLGSTGTQKVRIHSRMHQEDLADLLGATSRSVITILNKWRAEGLATFDGRSAQLTIMDIDRFRALAESAGAD